VLKQNYFKYTLGTL